MNHVQGGKMERMLVRILGIAIVFGVCLGGKAIGQAPVPDGAAEVSWTAPTTYVNGQPFTDADVAKYTVHQGKVSGTYDKHIDAGKGNLLLISYSPTDPPTKYYYAVTVTATNGFESGYSNEVSKTITPPAPAGPSCTVR